MANALIVVEEASVSYPVASLGGRSVKADLLRIFSASRPQAVVSALQGVSFEVYPGDRVAVIGSNGSGKTTLLRSLAGLYPLSNGRIVVRGAVRSLFELGLGVDLEESGRANIYNRGFAMGLSRREVAKVESEIEAFADIGAFMDMPVKSYSSGMQIRLMFAIATSFPTEVLLLDEFIGAGDAMFIARANARLKSMLYGAKCVVIATHSTSAALELCNRCIWLSKGQLLMDGAPDVVIARYNEWAARKSANLAEVELSASA